MRFIELIDVSFAYQKELVLQNVSISLDRQCTGMIGRNGSGKTTFGKLCCGLLNPLDGKVIVDGEDVNRMTLSDIGNKIGYLFQNPDKQIFALNVRDELSFAMRLNHIEKKTIEEKISNAATRFNIESLLDAKYHQLSKGEKQRVALATIFIRDPHYIILDEPTTGFDNEQKERLSGVIDEIKANDVGILIIGHDKRFIEKHAKRVLTCEQKQVVEATR